VRDPSDGKLPAMELAKALKQRGYECFLDVQNYTPGDD
jgi:hypothetical protein